MTKPRRITLRQARDGAMKVLHDTEKRLAAERRPRRRVPREFWLETRAQYVRWCIPAVSGNQEFLLEQKRRGTAFMLVREVVRRRKSR